MRDIKFRAWNTKSKEMFSAEEMAEDQLTLLTTGQFINVHSANTRLSVIYPIETMIPLQYEQEVNEENSKFYEVFYHDGDASDGIGFKINRVYFKGNQCGAYIPRFIPKTTSKMVVIGNIYENPELLNKAA